MHLIVKYQNLKLLKGGWSDVYSRHMLWVISQSICTIRSALSRQHITKYCPALPCTEPKT